MDKKNTFKLGMFFGIVMAVVYDIQNLLTHSNLTFTNIIIIILKGLIAGALAGFLFGWVMRLFANSKMLTKDTKIETHANESILFDTEANHFKGIEGVGEKLYLTNKRLVFKSHKFNIQNHEISINLPDIDKIDRYKILGLSDNGLLVSTTNNKTEKFVVQAIEEWLNQLEERKCNWRT